MDLLQHRLAHAIAQFVEWITKGFITKDEALETLSFYILSWHHPDAGRRRGIRSLSLTCLFFAGLYTFKELWVPSIDRQQLTAALLDNCWVSYDPRSADPSSGDYPDTAALQRDMAAIHDAGFTGVVTFSSAGSLGAIPEIARANGLSTIMGIWDPMSMSELRAAISQRRFTVGYVVGHYRLDAPGGYSLEDLRWSVEKLKRESWRPVTISEAIGRYSDPRIAGLGDWLFPDVHPRLLDDKTGQLRSDIQRDVAQTVADVRDAATAAQHNDRVLLLKMLTYPWNGVPEASPERQYLFYASLIETLKSNESHLAVRANYVAHSAFDAPWKRGRMFRPWDPFTGLLDSSGHARPAVSEIVRDCH